MKYNLILRYKERNRKNAKEETIAKNLSTNEIAKMAGVSQTTVMNALHGRTGKMKKETYDKIMQIAEWNGYVKKLAPGLMNRGSTKLVGVFLGEIEDEFKERCLNLLVMLEQEMYRSDSYILLHITDSEAEILKYAKAWGLCGIIVMGNEMIVSEYLEKEEGIPVRNIDENMIKSWSDEEIRGWVKTFSN